MRNYTYPVYKTDVNVSEKRTIPRGIQTVLPAFLCALIVSLSTLGGPLLPEWIEIDSAVFRYVGSVVLAGGMPYLDTFDHKGPLLYLIDAAGLLLHKTYGIWIMELATLLITFLIFCKIARLAGCTLRASMASLFCGACVCEYYLFGGNLTEEYALPFLSASLYIFLRYFMEGKTTKWNLMLCGFSCAAVALLRANMIGLWAVMSVGVLVHCILQKKWLEIFYDLLWFAIGFCALAVPILLWLYWNHAFTDFVQDYLLFNFLYSSSTLRGRYNAFYYFALQPLILFSMGIYFYFCVVKRENHTILCLLSAGCNLLLASLPGRPYNHYAMIFIPLILYALSQLFAEVETIGEKNKRAAAFLTVILISFAASSRGFLTAAQHVYAGGDRESVEIARIVRENSHETDRITVCGNWDQIYLFSGRWSVSRYSYQSPASEIDARIEEEYFSDVETRRPEIIVLPASFYAYDRMKEITRRNYRLLETVSDTEIYQLAA